MPTARALTFTSRVRCDPKHTILLLYFLVRHLSTDRLVGVIGGPMRNTEELLEFKGGRQGIPMRTSGWSEGLSGSRSVTARMPGGRPQGRVGVEALGQNRPCGGKISRVTWEECPQNFPKMKPFRLSGI